MHTCTLVAAAGRKSQILRSPVPALSRGSGSTAWFCRDAPAIAVVTVVSQSWCCLLLCCLYQVKKLHWSSLSPSHLFRNTLSSGQDTYYAVVQDFCFLFPRVQISVFSSILSLCRVTVASRTSSRKPSINLFKSSTFLNTTSLEKKTEGVFKHYMDVDKQKCNKLKVQRQHSFQMSKHSPIKNIKPLL